MTRGYAAIGLHMPKTPANVGSVLRSAGCFDVAAVIKSGRRYRNASTDTQKAYRHLPLIEVDSLREAIPYGAIPVAVDLVDGACHLHEYVHPERAFYVFGPEDGTLGEDVLSWCPHRVMIPTRYCLNLAVTVGAILYDRQAKHLRGNA
jgi:tRNA(Leu) C34 or U34 (ribose-2'-O)-methylase TrmL